MTEKEIFLSERMSEVRRNCTNTINKYQTIGNLQTDLEVIKLERQIKVLKLTQQYVNMCISDGKYVRVALRPKVVTFQPKPSEIKYKTPYDFIDIYPHITDDPCESYFNIERECTRVAEIVVNHEEE